MKTIYAGLVLVLVISLALGGAVAAQDDDNDDSPVPVGGVSLDLTAFDLVVDGSVTLTATVTPENATNQNLEWSSSDTGVATVEANSPATVTAVAPGTATITVTTEDGGYTATADVTVRAEAAQATPPTGGSALFYPGAGALLLMGAAAALRRLQTAYRQ